MEKAITAADDGSDDGSTLCEYAINAIGQEREFSRPGGVTQRLALVVLSLFDNEFTISKIHRTFWREMASTWEKAGQGDKELQLD